MIDRIPVWLRAVVGGLLVAAVGILPWAGLAELNLRSGGWPWAAVVELPLLAVTRWWLGGGGPPASTSESRRRMLRAHRVRGTALRWSLIAGLSYSVTLVAITVVGWQVAAPSPSAAAEIRELSGYPLTLIVPVLVVGSLVAGVMEEAAFRGYMQEPLEKRYGGLFAIGLVAFVFAAAHFPNPILLPIFALAATGWGVLAYATRSILVPLVFHVAVDSVGWLWFVVAPDAVTELLMTGVADGVSPTFVAWLAAFAVGSVFTVWSMMRLLAITGGVESQ